jgi:hypothetical protein
MFDNRAFVGLPNDRGLEEFSRIHGIPRLKFCRKVDREYMSGDGANYVGYLFCIWRLWEWRVRKFINRKHSLSKDDAVLRKSLSDGLRRVGGEVEMYVDQGQIWILFS